MWSISAVCTVCILFGILCDVKQVRSQPKVTYRATPEATRSLEEDIKRVISQIHSLSGAKDHTQRSFTPSPAGQTFTLEEYYDMLGNLYAVIQPLLTQSLDDLPKLLVCLLSGRQDCGPEAELTKTVALELVQPLLAFVSSLGPQTCAPQGTVTGPFSFSRAYLSVGESVSAVFSGFQQTFVNILSSFPPSGNLMTALGSLLDAAVTNVLQLVAPQLQVPMDYIKIVLQFGINLPSLDGKETCKQGDLKQLIMWGINNNVSWSFSTSLVDILLENFLAPSQPLCTDPGPECQNAQSSPAQRSVSPAMDDTRHVILSCDPDNLARLNDTLCADILEGSRAGSSTSVLALCQALDSLNSDQIRQVWSNMCSVVRALAFPLQVRSLDCSDTAMQPSSGVTPPSVTEAVPLRVAREAPNLRQLACDYAGWFENQSANAVLVTLCADNDREEFVKQVCSSSLLMSMLLADPVNSWLYAYCANSSANPASVISHFCNYEQWLLQPTVLVTPALLKFCMDLDGQRLLTYMCEQTALFVIVFSNPENAPFLPNCTNMPPPLPGGEMSGLSSCRYSEWHNVTQINFDVLNNCIQFDFVGFSREVCANKTFLNSLLQNQDNAWLGDLCRDSVVLPPTELPQPLNIADWCDYDTWTHREVDVSVIGLCWQNDQLAFQKNVCCMPSVLEKLLQDPRNKWLISVCTDIEEMKVIPQVCKYSDWSFPIMVDMTEVALCADSDSYNFTSKVCTNDTILQNLLTNQDNTWLLQHCANHSTSGVSPGGEGQGGGVTGFKPAEQCQYSSWSISLPDVTLLTLCWEHDQASFVSSVCPSPLLLLVLSQEPSSMWVSTMCKTYTNYSTTATNSTTVEPDSCLARHLVKQLGWNCSTDFTAACQPGASQNLVLEMMIQCWVENLKPRMEALLTTPVAALLEQTVSITVVVLLAVEEIQNSSLHVIENIRHSVLKSVLDYFEREQSFEKKRVLLQCFGTVLTSLMQTARDVTTEEFILMKEYFKIPLSSLRPVLRAANVPTVRLILRYYNRHKDTLKLSDEYLSTMMSVLLQTHVVTDGGLFPELANLLPFASPADIQNLPILPNENKVRETINGKLGQMTMDQRDAFGLWYTKVMSVNEITTGHQSLIRDTGNVIAYLPFRNFQHLSPAQLVDGLDVLQGNALTPLKQEFIIQNIIRTYRNLTAQDFIRLGKLTCLATPKDLLAYQGTAAFRVIQAFVMNCTREGLVLSSYLISSVLLNSTEFKAPSSLSVDRLAEVAHLLPLFGLTFLQSLTPSQLLAVRPALTSTSFSPAQAYAAVDRLLMSSSIKLTDPGELKKLGSLIVGVKEEVFMTLTADTLLSSLPDMALHTPGLSPHQAISLSSKLWGFQEVVRWLDEVDPLLYCTPLVSLLPRTPKLASNLTAITTKSFNTQQAKAIFRVAFNTNPNYVLQQFLNLGTLGQGVSCSVLQERFKARSSLSEVTEILALLRQQPRPLHTSLKSCVIDALYDLKFFSDLLKDLGTEIVMSMSMSMISKFSTADMDVVRRMIIQDPHYFLLLPRNKQWLLVDKMAQKMGMYTGLFTEEEFRSLGILAPFVEDEVFINTDRSFFTDNLNYLLGLCYSRSKMDLVARILQDPSVFGPVKNWTQATISQVDRFLFFLPDSTLREMSQTLMTVTHVERLFISQRRWENGDVGAHCLTQSERAYLFQKQQFVLQFFLGFIIINPQSPPPMVPTCEILYTLPPAAWPSSSLTSMSPSAFSNCLELMGHDPFLTPYQRQEVLKKVKQMYGPVSTFSQSVISQLGGLAMDLTVEELSSLRLTERRSIAALGAVSNWSGRQLTTLFTIVLNSTKQRPGQLDSSTLVAMGHIVCGATPTEIKSLNAVEFSKAALFLGQLKLSCSEMQLDAFVGLLTHPLAFGLISSWGAEVFIEIGVLAAGLPDIAMSALVKEQIEGITPLAISMIPVQRFYVALSHKQISQFSYEQAEAVTSEQFSALSEVQRTALALVITPWENRPVDFRGKSLGLALGHSPLCLSVGLLMLLIIQHAPELICLGT